MKPRTPHIRATLWPWAVCLCAALAAPAQAVAVLKFNGDWDVYTLQGARVGGGDDTFYSGAQLLREAVSDSLNNPGASQTTVTRVFEEVLTAGIKLGTPVLPANWLRGMPLVNGLTYDWTLTMRVNAGAIAAIFANNAPPEAVSRSSFGNTYYRGGLEGVFDASGQPLSGVILSTDSGFDLVTVSAVPEPGKWALWLGGLAVMGHLLRRRAASLT